MKLDYFKNFNFNKYKLPIFLFIVVFLFSLIVRLPSLGYESINPDAVNWHYRCQQFANGLKFFQFEKTYPHYHPGVTLCYVMFFPTEIYKQVTNQVYDSQTFMEFNFYNTLTLVVVISLLISWVVLKIGGWSGLLFAFLLNFEPFFYGNSRLIHLDTLTALFLFLAIFYLVEYIKSNSFKTLSFSSFLFSLAFLTKSVSIVFIVVAIFLVTYFSRTRKLFRCINFVALTFVTIILLFPATWVNPIGVFDQIFSEAERVGIRNPHNQYFLGVNYTEDEKVSNLFYFWTVLIKFSPLIVIGIIFLILEILYNTFRSFRSRSKSIWTFFLEFVEKNKVFFAWVLFYTAYLFVLLYSSKKIDRYLLLFIPPLVYYLSLKTNMLIRKNIIVLGLINVVSVFYFMPYLFLYYSPVFLEYKNVNNLVGQKSFGQGIYQLKENLIANYGEINLGFYDVKPMQSIYPNSKIFDIRSASSSKIDVVILSINEVLPDDYKDDFIKKESFYLIDIPLYDIYVKK